MINYVTSSFKWFFKLEAASGLMLLFAAVSALIISNSALSEDYFNFLNIHFSIGVD
ncbi:MAG: Na+:H+ antiporter, NhaA family, partial [Pelagibacterales bacterium]|nr:Na+:H+ antiporter, NhaA family [Pelagibacterales bacterium]